ncbi:M50 family metallopeptidase [Streptomyces sp. NPDC051567]|uniref:M50 family metallopeptidase n=1 Tax=Streptomyces sp. NPDC051567 TaxID=3365660 RepID=UPI0037A63099
MDSTTTTTGLWDRLTGIQTAPDPWLVVVTGLVALGFVGVRPLWALSRNAVTIAHEGGHGLLALLTGRRLDGIRLHSDTSGVTVSRGRPSGPGMVLTAAAGYTAAPLLGLGGAALLSAHRITLLLWAATALLAVMLVMIRNAYGALTVILTGATFLLVSWLAPAPVQAVFAYGVVWFLLLGGVRPVFELGASRRSRRGRAGSTYRSSDGAPDSDADQLGRLTHVPAVVWLLVFHVVALCSLVGGGRWLLGL